MRSCVIGEECVWDGANITTDCSQLAMRIVGDCSHCGGRFCGRHRLLEDHNCQGLGDAREKAKGELGERVLAGRTVASKV